MEGEAEGGEVGGMSRGGGKASRRGRGDESIATPTSGPSSYTTPTPIPRTRSPHTPLFSLICLTYATRHFHHDTFLIPATPSVQLPSNATPVPCRGTGARGQCRPCSASPLKVYKQALKSLGYFV